MRGERESEAVHTHMLFVRALRLSVRYHLVSKLTVAVVAIGVDIVIAVTFAARGGGHNSDTDRCSESYQKNPGSVHFRLLSLFSLTPILTLLYTLEIENND